MTRIESSFPCWNRFSLIPSGSRRCITAVTGASSGIGAEFARELAHRGHPVLAVARRVDRLEARAAEVSKSDGRIQPFAADLKAPEGATQLLQHLPGLGEIDLLVNNAGIAPAGDFAASSEDEATGAIRLNVEAVVRLTHGALSAMLPRRRGAIINVASVVAFQPFPHFAVYAASKAFVFSFTEAVAEEIKGTGVRILALCPGNVAIEMDVFAHNAGLLGKLPSLAATNVVNTSLDTMARGRVVKVVGGLNSFLPFSDRFLPRSTVRWLMGINAKAPHPEAQSRVRETP